MTEPGQQDPQKGQEPKSFSRADAFRANFEKAQAKHAGASEQRDPEPVERGEPSERASEKGAQQDTERQARDDRGDPDLKDVPPELMETAVKIKKSLKADHTKKTQRLADERKKFETELQEHEAWRPFRDVWSKADGTRRRAIEMAAQGQFDDVVTGRGPAKRDDSENPDGDDDLDAFLAELDEPSRPIAKKLVEQAERRAARSLKVKDETIQQLQERLDRLENRTTERDQAETRAYAERTYGEFLKAVPDYESYDEDFREDFEDFFESKLAKNPGLTPLEAWKRFTGHVDKRASEKTGNQLKNLASRAERAPVVSPGQAGVSRPPDAKSLSRREIFAHHAGKRNIPFR